MLSSSSLARRLLLRAIFQREKQDNTLSSKGTSVSTRAALNSRFQFSIRGFSLNCHPERSEGPMYFRPLACTGFSLGERWQFSFLQGRVSIEITVASRVPVSKTPRHQLVPGIYPPLLPRGRGTALRRACPCLRSRQTSTTRPACGASSP